MSTSSSTASRPAPGPIRALDDIPGYPSRDRVIPAGISCREICERYPNHLRDEILEDFIYWNWSAKQIFDALHPHVQAHMSSNHTITHRNRNPSNVLAKRLEKRRNRFIRAGGLEQIMKRRNVRPHGMAITWSGANKNPEQRRAATAGRENSTTHAIAPLTPATTSNDLDGTTKPGSGTGHGFSHGDGFQRFVGAPPMHVGSALEYFNFNDPIPQTYQGHDERMHYWRNSTPHPPPHPSPRDWQTYDQQRVYTDDYDDQHERCNPAVLQFWDGNNQYISPMPSGGHESDDMYGDGNDWDNNAYAEGAVPNATQPHDYMDPNQAMRGIYEHFEYPDPMDSDRAAPAHQQYDAYVDPMAGTEAAPAPLLYSSYTDPMLAGQVDEGLPQFDIYTDLAAAPPTAQQYYPYPAPEQDQENLDYADGVDGDYDDYDGYLNVNEDWKYKDDQY